MDDLATVVPIIAGFLLLREEHRARSLDLAFARVKMHRDFGAGYLVLAVVHHGTAGQRDGMLGLVEHGVVAGRPSRALAHPHVVVGDHLLDLVEILAIGHRQRVAGQGRVGLHCTDVAAKGHHVALVIEVECVRLDIDRALVAGKLQRGKRAVLGIFSVFAILRADFGLAGTRL